MRRRVSALHLLTAVCVLCVPSACATAQAGPVGSGDGSMAAVAAAERFLDDYLGADGRVSRTDQGGDTVSEGQAYAMLLAVGLRDETRFRSAWGWTAANMQRADGLLSWRWQHGRVVDGGAASDADLVAAWALGLAGERFRDPTLSSAATRIGRAVIASESVAVQDGRMLVAGPWATTSEVVNPSYLVLGAMSQLWWLNSDPTWSTVAASARRVLDTQTRDAPHLPSDWSTIDGVAAPAPNGTTARFSYDAGRVLVQLAMDCDPTGRALAARAWPFFASIDPDHIAAAYSTSGGPMGSPRHPITLVAAAASAHAAGDRASASRLLDTARDLDGRIPTYYGSAWIAISRMVLDTRMLGGCA